MAMFIAALIQSLFFSHHVSRIFVTCEIDPVAIPYTSDFRAS